MEIKVYLHGVVIGQSFSTQNEDKESLRNFYDIAQNSEVDSFFVVEIRNKNIYYTLIKSKLINKDGRGGSYFGLTLRLDEFYCEDIENIFYLLEDIYKGKVINSIIKNRQYIVSEFSEKKVKDIHDTIHSFFEKNFRTYLQPIDNTFSKQKSSVFKFNISEISNKSIIDVLKKNLIIYLSSEYSTLNNKVKGLEQNLNNKNSENATLKNQIDSLTTEKNRLESKNKELNEQNKKLQSQKSFSENINKIETPIEEIAKYLKKSGIQQGKEKYSVKKILLIVIAALLFINVFMFFKFNRTLNAINKNTSPEYKEIVTESDEEFSNGEKAQREEENDFKKDSINLRKKENILKKEDSVTAHENKEE